MLQLSVLRLGYIGVFLLAAAGCFFAGWRAHRIAYPETRRALVWFLGIVGVWALAEALRLLATNPVLEVGFYLAGLIVGLASVGAWLYFCSAYTGQPYHRNATYRRLAVGIYLAIIAVKLTNPLHGLYFTARHVAAPFPHLAITQSLLHWVVVGVVYALSAIGFYMLFQRFTETRYDTTVLGILVATSGIPALLTIVGYVHPGPILELNYEPLGVAIFAVGTLRFAEDTFQAVQQRTRRQVLDELDEAVVLLDPDRRIQDYNAKAEELFSSLSCAVLGDHVDTVIPEVTECLETTDTVLERGDADDQRYFALTNTTLTQGDEPIGKAIIFTDITEVERQRRELAQREAQLEDLTAAITHELRNALNLVAGHLEMAQDALDDVDGELATTAHTHQQTAQETVERMERVIDDLAELAKYGGTIDTTEACDLRIVVDDAWAEVESADVRVVVTGDARIEAEPTRIRHLFERAIRFADANGATEVRITPTSDGFIVEDDGEPVAPDRVPALFEYGAAVPDAERGSLLPTVRTLAQVHSWAIEGDREYHAGVRYRITGATVDSGHSSTGGH